MKRETHLLLQRQIERALNNQQLMVVSTKDDYEKVPVRKRAKGLVSEAIRICLKNGLTPHCAIDGEGRISAEITTINLREIWDLIKNLDKIESLPKIE